MLDWFWNLPLMVRLQEIVDESRAGAPEPLMLITILLVAAFIIVWRLSTSRAERDGPMPGESYLGKITPKTIDKMTVNNRVQKPKSRADIAAALKSRKRR
ncbi:hypothetical protein [Algicella marina]|uniref:Uncharacterized protein n=1 Tax=Algicella marina TaxID=2683284 RepID=A0A6P1T277_9RHOB|nr:hypothetical protein [Algicella marina]QHQ35900.1 hypothetical protein GO499_12305 [Algicella marina]